MERQAEKVIECTTEARAGATGHNARYVLIASTVGLVVLFVAIYFFFFA